MKKKLKLKIRNFYRTVIIIQRTGKRWAESVVMRKNKFGTQNILNRGAPVLDNLTNFSNSTKTAVF